VRNSVFSKMTNNERGSSSFPIADAKGTEIMMRIGSRALEFCRSCSNGKHRCMVAAARKYSFVFSESIHWQSSIRLDPSPGSVVSASDRPFGITMCTSWQEPISKSEMLAVVPRKRTAQAFERSTREPERKQTSIFHNLNKVVGRKNKLVTNYHDISTT
jgi:hypothetical protein